MKKIILILLPLLFLTFSCEIESEPPKDYEGEWTNEESGDVFTFTSNTFLLEPGESSFNIKQNGSLSEKNDVLTLTASHIYGDEGSKISIDLLGPDLGILAFFIYDNLKLTWSVDGSTMILTSEDGTEETYTN